MLDLSKYPTSIPFFQGSYTGTIGGHRTAASETSAIHSILNSLVISNYRLTTTIRFCIHFCMFLFPSLVPDIVRSTQLFRFLTKTNRGTKTDVYEDLTTIALRAVIMHGILFQATHYLNKSERQRVLFLVSASNFEILHVSFLSFNDFTVTSQRPIENMFCSKIDFTPCISFRAQSFQRETVFQNR